MIVNIALDESISHCKTQLADVETLLVCWDCCTLMLSCCCTQAWSDSQSCVYHQQTLASESPVCIQTKRVQPRQEERRLRAGEADTLRLELTSRTRVWPEQDQPWTQVWGSRWGDPWEADQTWEGEDSLRRALGSCNGSLKVFEWNIFQWFPHSLTWYRGEDRMIVVEWYKWWVRLRQERWVRVTSVLHRSTDHGTGVKWWGHMSWHVARLLTRAWGRVVETSCDWFGTEDWTLIGWWLVETSSVVFTKILVPEATRSPSEASLLRFIGKYSAKFRKIFQSNFFHFLQANAQLFV